MPATAAILAALNEETRRKAQQALAEGAYRVVLTFRNDVEIRGRIEKRQGQGYNCTVGQSGAMCSCPDALYRRRLCKHVILLALHEESGSARCVSSPKESPPPNLTRRPGLKLVKVRPGFMFSP